MTDQAPPGWAQPAAVAPAPPVAPHNPHRAWQAISIGLIIIGLVISAFAIGVVSLASQQPDLELNRVYIITLLVLGAGLFLIGCVANLARALVVRRFLPPTRYRGGSVLLMLLIAVFGANAVAFLFSQDLVGLLTGQPGTSDLATLVLLTVLQVWLLVVTAIFVLLPRALGAIPFFSGDTPRAVLRGFLWAIPAWFVATLLGVIVEKILALFNVTPEPQTVEQVIGGANPVIVVVAVVVVAPIAEEVFFRGVAFGAWAREYGPRRAVVMSAVLFAVIHASLAALVPIFVLGLALAVIYWRTRNLASSIALHATFNTISVVIALLVRYGVFPPPT